MVWEELVIGLQGCWVAGWAAWNQATLQPSNSSPPFPYNKPSGVRMNSRKRLIYSLLALVLAGGCKILGERKIVHIDKQWPAAGVRHVEINEVDGTINVEASDSNQITMNAVVRTRVSGKPNEENQGFFQTELAGDTLTI